MVTQLKKHKCLVPEVGLTSLPDLLLASLCKQGSNPAAKRKELKEWSKNFKPSL
jgi:hypothetical protein